MTIKEVSFALGKDESTIRKIGKGLFPDVFKNGVATHLSEVHVTAIKLNLGKNSELPKTELEKELLIQQAMFFQAEKIQTMQNQIELMRPKAELADKAIRDESKHYSIRDAGKQLGLTQTEIFNIMRSKRMLTEKNLPTQRALDYGVLQYRTNACQDGKNRPQAIMTFSNISEFKRRYL